MIEKNGVSAMICDQLIFLVLESRFLVRCKRQSSTNNKIKTNRILVTSFASNVARMESVFYVQKRQDEISV